MFSTNKQRDTFSRLKNAEGVRFWDNVVLLCHVVCNSIFCSGIIDKMGISWTAHSQTSVSLSFAGSDFQKHNHSYHSESFFFAHQHYFLTYFFAAWELRFRIANTPFRPGHGIISVLRRPQGRQNLEILRALGLGLGDSLLWMDLGHIFFRHLKNPIVGGKKIWWWMNPHVDKHDKMLSSFTKLKFCPFGDDPPM